MTEKKILIIQTSPKHTASTFLVNALYGFFQELNNKKILFLNETNFIYEDNFNNIGIVKSHNTNIDELIEKYESKYELYFICSQRLTKNLYISKKYETYKNVLVFMFTELNETKENSIENIINNIHNKISILLSKHEFIILNKETAIERILNMNKRYDEIKNKPFEFIDPFYEIHGSHRNRRC